MEQRRAPFGSSARYSAIRWPLWLKRLEKTHDMYLEIIKIKSLKEKGKIMGIYNFLIYVWVPEVGNTADTPNPPWKEIWESPRVNENLTSVGLNSRPLD